MRKITKKDRIKVLEWQVKTLIQSMTNIEEWSSYADNMLTELNHALPDPEYDAKCEAQEASIDESLDRHRERLGLNKPQLKQLDQSVFDGLSNELRFASVDDDGRGFAFDVKPELMSCEWDVPCNKICQFIDEGYDASNWQNSLIERDDTAKELIGSELCKAMLARGDKYISGFGHHQSDDGAVYSTFADTVTRYSHCFHSAQNSWDYFVPINNQGEPLTATDVGL